MPSVAQQRKQKRTKNEKPSVAEQSKQKKGKSKKRKNESKNKRIKNMEKKNKENKKVEEKVETKKKIMKKKKGRGDESTKGLEQRLRNLVPLLVMTIGLWNCIKAKTEVGRATDTETRQTHKNQRQHHHRHQNRYQITPHIFLIMTLELTRCKVKTMGKDMIRPEHRRSTHGPITRPRHTPHEKNHNRIQIPYHNQADRAVQDEHNKLIHKPIRKPSKDWDARDN